MSSEVKLVGEAFEGRAISTASISNVLTRIINAELGDIGISAEDRTIKLIPFGVEFKPVFVVGVSSLETKDENEVGIVLELNGDKNPKLLEGKYFRRVDRGKDTKYELSQVEALFFLSLSLRALAATRLAYK